MPNFTNSSKFINNLMGGNTERKLQKEIENTEFKKRSLVTPLQNEINVSNVKISEELRQIGLHVYESHLKDETPAIDTLQNHYEAIALQKAIIAEKEAKIEKFLTRYDEEINIFKSNLSTSAVHPQEFVPVAPTTSTEDMAFCTSCGTRYRLGEGLFCTGCGSKLT